MELLAIVFALLLFAGAILYFSFSWGFVLFKFWYWFLLPVFITLPHIEYYQAIGLLLFISLSKSSSKADTMKKEFKDSEKSISAAIVTFLAPWIVLCTGYFIKLLMF